VSTAAQAIVRLTQGGHAVRLPDGRLHLQHGPIDLLIDIDAPAAVREAGEARAVCRFDPLLGRLAARRAELSRTIGTARKPSTWPEEATSGDRVAARMHRAVAGLTPFTDFVTPMAAVAGSVADEMLAAIGTPVGLRSASVNNGGDIALRIASGDGLCIGVGTPEAMVLGRMRLERPGRHGIATSGWRGRSHSLGIADAVTVLSNEAASADAAATLIANAVNVRAPGCIERRPACELDEDSDLGGRAVTVAVGALSEALCDAALQAGWILATRMRDQGLIEAAFIVLQGRHRVVPVTDSRVSWTNGPASASIGVVHRARGTRENHATGR